MRVRFRQPPRESYPAEEAAFVQPKQLFLSPTKEYEVYAVSVYKGITFLQVLDDKDTPNFRPRILFEVVDPSIPPDWICNVFAEGPVQLVMGPPFVARDLESYDRMIDRRLPQFEEFWKRINWGRPKGDEIDDE